VDKLAHEFPQFDFDTISDVVLHIQYTARDSGAILRKAAVAHLTDRSPARRPDRRGRQGAAGAEPALKVRCPRATSLEATALTPEQVASLLRGAVGLRCATVLRRARVTVGVGVAA
jgi:hypothetical protein